MKGVYILSKFSGITKRVKGFAFAVKNGAKRRSPEILMAVGAVGVVATTVTACVQTRKLDDILTEHESTMNRIKNLQEESAKIGEPNNYGKETVMAYTATGVKIARLYALPLTMGAASLFCFFGAHKILKKRALALAAAYNALDTTFKQYRGRVTERFGEEVEKQIRHGVTPKEVEETVTDENGETKTIKKTVEVADGKTSPYQRYFTRSNPRWDNSPDAVYFMLKGEMRAMNDLLMARAYSNPHGIGYVTFNEVLERLKFEMPIDGSGLLVGWIYDAKNPLGDNYIDFDVKACMLPGENGKLEKAYSIDFNVDGDVYKELHDRDLARLGRAV